MTDQPSSLPCGQSYCSSTKRKVPCDDFCALNLEGAYQKALLSVGQPVGRATLIAGLARVERKLDHLSDCIERLLENGENG